MKTSTNLTRITLLALCFLGAFAPAARAQVKGISYSISPVGEYLDWEKNTGISNGFLVGGHLGFGFGEFVELRGTYLQSLDMKRNFGPLDLKELKGVELSQPGIDVTRWGGDLKLNLSRGSVVPFLTAGTGVQSFKSDSLATYKNIYVSLGGGLQFVVADRYTLGIQAVNTSFNDSPVRNLTTAAERDANGLDVANYENELLKNWSVRASLSFYLGGRRPGDLTEMDKAYLNNFSGGFSLPIEITAGQLDFAKALPYANTKFVGAATGFNFGPYVGLRGYYWRAMDTDYFSSFDRLSVYGGEGKFKLANGQGLTPSINVGGGVIDALKGYEVDGVALDEKNRPFVSGGLGLDIPFGRAFKLTAYGKALLTSNDPLENATDPGELATSWAYGLSANLILGNGVKKVQTEKESSYDELVQNNMKREKNRAKKLKDSYEDRIDQLDDQIKEARQDGNRRLANDLEDDREALRDAVDQIDQIQKEEDKANADATRKQDPLLMKMNPTDFGKKLDTIEDNAPKARRSNDDRDSDRTSRDRDSDRTSRQDRDSGQDSKTMRALEERLQSIEDKLDDIQQQNNDYRQNPRNFRNNDNRRGDNRNSRRPYTDNRSNDSGTDDRDFRNQNYDPRDGNFQDNDSRNSDYRNNGDYNDRPDFKSNAGGTRNGDYRSNDPMEMMKAERQKSEELSAAYEDRISKLEEEVKNAKAQGNDQIEKDLGVELKSMQESIQKLKDAQKREGDANRDAYQRNDPSQLRMKSEDFGSVLDSIQRSNERYREQIERSMEKSRKEYEKQLNSRRDSQRGNQDNNRKDLENELDQLRKELRDMKYNRANRNAEKSDQDNKIGVGVGTPGASNVSPDEQPAAASMTNLGQRTEEQLAFQSDNIAKTGFFNQFNYDGSSALAGINLGGATTLNIGIRNHYRYKDSNFSAMPEAFFGFGSGSAFGLFLNGIYNLKLKNQSDFVPYGGLGVGVMKIGNSDANNTKLGFNIILGANLFKVANGRFYVDVTARNFFRYTQLAAGYRLPF